MRERKEACGEEEKERENNVGQDWKAAQGLLCHRRTEILDNKVKQAVQLTLTFHYQEKETKTKKR